VAIEVVVKQEGDINDDVRRSNAKAELCSRETLKFGVDHFGHMLMRRHPILLMMVGPMRSTGPRRRFYPAPTAWTFFIRVARLR
jgi:hypothetical protein